MRAVCAQIEGCATTQTCTSNTNSQCAKCNSGYYLSNGVKDACVKCPPGDRCDGLEKKCASGSPKNCKVEHVQVTGYSAGGLVKVTSGKKVKKSTEANSCPTGWKIWSPRNKNDWTLVYNALGKNIHNYPRGPHLIVDVTRDANGCGGCGDYAMKSGVSEQSTWRTTDGSDWWLRDTKYHEPSGDYDANCYLGVEHVTPVNVQFNDADCIYSSNAYLCQPKIGAFVVTVVLNSPVFAYYVSSSHLATTYLCCIWFSCI